MKTLLSLIHTGALTAAIYLTVQPAHAYETKKILFFSKSAGFEHEMVKERDGNPSKAQKALEELGQKNNFEFTFTKDGGVFTPANIAKYDAFFFYTTGDLTTVGTDGNPAMSPAGKAALLSAIAHGKGFIGTHSASDTFHSAGGAKPKTPARYINDGENADPYIKMLGAEFILHGSQQKAHQIIIDKHFPGMSSVPDDFGPLEEWYSLKDFAPNLHVLLMQDTSKMNTNGNNVHAYARPNYPSTWAHLYGSGAAPSFWQAGATRLMHKTCGHAGRVFYTSMGHRDDMWTNPVFQAVLVGGINWAVGNVDADVTPNLKCVAPQASTLPPG